jgi:spermidine synthase
VRYVEVARALSERGEVVLRERVGDAPDGGSGVLELRVNGVFVMDSRETRTERALATAALDRVERPHDVLVGGLGLGYTAQAVLADGRVRRLVVVELEETLVGWLRDGTVPHGPALLADDRLEVVVADVRRAVEDARPASYDLVLLDVDNGPDFLVHDANAELYRTTFLHAVRAVLRPGGVLVVWSAAPSAALEAALTEVFGIVEPVPLEVRLQAREESYWLYLAREGPTGRTSGT